MSAGLLGKVSWQQQNSSPAGGGGRLTGLTRWVPVPHLMADGVMSEEAHAITSVVPQPSRPGSAAERARISRPPWASAGRVQQRAVGARPASPHGTNVRQEW